MRPTFLAAATLGWLLAACTSIQDSLHPGEIATIEANWLPAEVSPRPPALYCYRTLGRQDCYRTPLEGDGRRLVEHYGPPPALLGY